jgi:GNAT superfamily N-acetyltransferase
VGGCRTSPATEADADLGLRAAEVQGLAIVPSRTGAGLGRRLLGHAVNDLLVRSHAPVFAWIAEADAGAVAFFARHGFRPDGRRRDGVVRLVRQPCQAATGAGAGSLGARAPQARQRSSVG